MNMDAVSRHELNEKIYRLESRCRELEYALSRQASSIQYSYATREDIRRALADYESRRSSAFWDNMMIVSMFAIGTLLMIMSGLKR